MMKKLIIYGITDMAEYVYYFINRDVSADVVAFTVEKKYLNKDVFFDRPVVSFENIENKYPPSEYEMFIAIGPTNMSKIRQEYFEIARGKGYSLFSYISKNAIVSSQIGENNFVGDFTVINPNVKVGDNNIIYEHCIFSTKSVIGNHCYVAPRSVIGSHSKINNNVILGMNSVVNTGINVADETLVGAQSYISADTKFKGVYGVKSATLIACISDKVSVNLI